MINITFMKRALLLAAKGKGKTSPNPMVGAVISDGSTIIAEGFHRKYGSIHAEADAIEKALERGHNMEKAVLYVTLEPCCHSGNGKINPPCTEKIIKAGIKKVVIASRDPNPKVMGRGISFLEEHGVLVTEGVLAEEEKELNHAYHYNTLKHLPYVHLKLAASLDSFITDTSGRSKWITCEKSRNLVHKWRASSDGIMAGIGTVLTDNPSLTARINGKYLKKQPHRIILDTKLRIPYKCSLVTDQFLSKTLIFYNPALSDKNKAARLSDTGVNLHPAETDSTGRLCLFSILKKLSDMEIISILAEGGSTLAGSLLNSRLVNRLSIFNAPLIIGKGTPLFSGFSRLLDSPVRISSLKIRKTGNDLLFTGIPFYGENNGGMS